MRTTILLAFNILLSSNVICQHEFNNIIVGHGQNSAVINLKDKTSFYVDSYNIAESACVFSDKSSGELELFANSNSIYNGDYEIIENGDGLFGNNSSSQGTIIVPHPCQCEQYFVFQNDIANLDQGMDNHYGLSYSIVDMNANSSKGKVIEKNIFLNDSISESFLVVKNSNFGYWLIVHKVNSSQFLIYKLDKDGIDPNYKEFTSSNYTDLPGRGSIISNINGDMVAYAQRGYFGNGYLEFLRFDKMNGLLLSDTTLVIHQPNEIYPFGFKSAVFSPSSEYIYASGGFDEIYQINVQTLEYNLIFERDSIDEISSVYNMELQPDSTIYVSFKGNSNILDYIGVINKPDNIFTHIEFNPFEIELENIAIFNLPTAIPSFYNSEEYNEDFYLDFEVLIDNSNVFINNRSEGIFSMEMSFGDGRTCQEFCNTHTYENSDDYLLEIIAQNEIGCEKRYSKEVNISILDSIELETEKFEYKLFPTISNNHFFFESNKINSEIIVFNAAGKRIKSIILEEIGNKTISLKDYPSGVYYFHIFFENRSYLEKVVKIC